MSFYSRFCEPSSKFNFVAPEQSVHNCRLLTHFFLFYKSKLACDVTNIQNPESSVCMTYCNKDLCVSTSISVTACSRLQASEHRNLMFLQDVLAPLTLKLTL